MWAKYADGEWGFSEKTEDGTAIVADMERTGGPGTMWRGSLKRNGDVVFYSKGDFRYLRGAINSRITRLRRGEKTVC